MLLNKEQDLKYGFQGATDNSSGSFEDYKNQSPLKGENWEIAKTAYFYLADLKSVLPTEDNSIITAVVVCLNLLTEKLWSIGY